MINKSSRAVQDTTETIRRGVKILRGPVADNWDDTTRREKKEGDKNDFQLPLVLLLYLPRHPTEICHCSPVCNAEFQCSYALNFSTVVLSPVHITNESRLTFLEMLSIVHKFVMQLLVENIAVSFDLNIISTRILRVLYMNCTNANKKYPQHVHQQW